MIGTLALASVSFAGPQASMGPITTGDLGTCIDGKAPSREQVSGVKYHFPKLANGKFRVMEWGRDGINLTYNCYGWSVGEPNEYFEDPDIENAWGDGEEPLTIKEMDKFFGHYKFYSSDSHFNSDVVLYTLGAAPKHAARAYVCQSGEWVFESKLGIGPRILHRKYAVTGTTYGSPYKGYDKRD